MAIIVKSDYYGYLCKAKVKKYVNLAAESRLCPLRLDSEYRPHF